MERQMKTTTAARELGVPVYTLLNWIRYQVIPTPPRDDSGHFLWTSESILAARKIRDERRPSHHESITA